MNRIRTSEFWYCNVCHAQNHETDGECQYCDCGGVTCERDNCSAPEHFHTEHDEPIDVCRLCCHKGGTGHTNGGER